MPPRSPLAPRHGLQAAWVRTPDRDRTQVPAWSTFAEFLTSRLAADAPVAAMLAGGRFVFADGTALDGSEPYTPHTFVWFHRELRDEPVRSWDLSILYRDERLVVLDKPHQLSSIPRGRHVLQSAVVLLRQQLGLDELSPVHRLDRLTAGVLIFTTEQRWRRPYQQVFEHRQVTKSYDALAGYRSDLALPRTVRSHIVKRRGELQVAELSDEPPNAETVVELLEKRGHRDNAVGRQIGHYRLIPRTGRTHQLRVHLSSLGIPILGDPLYPTITQLDPDDHRVDLQLIARHVAFVDPLDATARSFTSQREFTWVD